MKRVRKTLAVMLIICLLACSIPNLAFASSLPFTDVPQSAWYRSAVEYAYEEGLFQGVSSTEFNPTGTMTRGMLVQVLANRTIGFNKSDWLGKTNFTDVSPSAWYAPAVSWASTLGIVSGKGNAKFDPNGKVTRQEMAVVMYNYAQKTGNDISLNSNALNKFSDINQVASWAKVAMQWAATHNIINGSGGKVNPKGFAQRCQVAQVFLNSKSVLINCSIIGSNDNVEDDLNIVNENKRLYDMILPIAQEYAVLRNQVGDVTVAGYAANEELFSGNYNACYTDIAYTMLSIENVVEECEICMDLCGNEVAFMDIWGWFYEIQTSFQHLLEYKAVTATPTSALSFLDETVDTINSFYETGEKILKSLVGMKESYETYGHFGYADIYL